MPIHAMHNMKTALCELETQLSGEDGSAAMAALIARLESVARRLESDLRTGLPPDAFRQSETCHIAIRAAIDALRTTRIG